MSFGRLERSKGSQPMSEINVTPLVDVMLVLVVIFIITAPLLSSAIKLDLPQTDAAKTNDAPKFVTIVVDKSANVFLGDQPIALAALSASLAASARANPYGKVVEVMGLAQKAGLNRIGFVADPALPIPSAP
jgi:biopolymer transport protein TolR